MMEMKRMKTLIYNTKEMDEAVWLEAAGRILAEGGLVAIPTETVYGLQPMPWMKRRRQKSMRQRDGLRIIR